MFSSTLILVALVVFWYMTAIFLTALTRRNIGIVDVAWAPGFLLAALATLWWNQPSGYLPLIATVLVAVWALRLSLHVLLRNWGIGEDWRYADMRKRWGDWFALHSFVRVFLLQGFLLIVVSMPVLRINTFGGTLNWLVLVGGLVWLKGFLWETIGDYQLVRFLKNPAHHGRLLRTGLWRYSRHPNYFGEILQWWGLWLMALSTPGGWFTMVGPLTITFLITKVSGIPLLEARQKRYPEYGEYAKRTPVLIPWFPKK